MIQLLSLKQVRLRSGTLKLTILQIYMKQTFKFKCILLQTKASKKKRRQSRIFELNLSLFLGGNQKMYQKNEIFIFLIMQILNSKMSKHLIKMANEAETLSLFKQLYGLNGRKRRIYAYYNNKINRIITDEHLMMIPIDQRMATRAHAVFDVVYVKNLNIINLDSHLDRLMKSSESVAIKPPMKLQQIKQTIEQVLSQVMVKFLKQGKAKEELTKQVFGVRLTISSGYGDFGIASIDKQPILYITVFQPFIDYSKQKQGVNQFVVKFVKSPKELVHAKTVDYTHNALMANESKIRGGYQGIKALENGILLQAAAANIAFIFGNQFATPRFQTVIQGTTIKKLLKYIEQLKEEGKLQKISLRDISIEEGEKANEMMVIGGDKIVPVLNFNGKKISQKRGKFTQMFQSWYEKENEISLPIKLYDWE